MTSAETQAVRRDARDRLQELVNVRETLRPDVDDSRVLSEYVSVEQQIAKLKAALWPQS